MKKLILVLSIFSAMGCKEYYLETKIMHFEDRYESVTEIDCMNSHPDQTYEWKTTEYDVAKSKKIENMNKVMGQTLIIRNIFVGTPCEIANKSITINDDYVQFVR